MNKETNKTISVLHILLLEKCVYNCYLLISCMYILIAKTYFKVSDINDKEFGISPLLSTTEVVITNPDDCNNMFK